VAEPLKGKAKLDALIAKSSQHDNVDSLDGPNI